MSSHVNRLPRIVENCRSSVRFCHQVDLLGIPFISEVGGGNVPFRAAKQTDRLRPICRLSALRPKSAMTPDQGRGPLRFPVKIACSKWNAGKRCSTPTALPGQMQLIWGLGLADRPQSITDDRRSSVFRSELNTMTSAVPIT